MIETKSIRPADWTDAANVAGRQAILDAEQRIRDTRSPADLARDYRTPEELAKLRALEADVAAAIADGVAAERLMAEEKVHGEGGTGATMIGGTLTARRASDGGFDGAAWQRQTRRISAAVDAEGVARGLLTDYELELNAAGQARWTAATKKASK